MRSIIIPVVTILLFTCPCLGQNIKKGVIVSDSITISPFPMERYIPTIEDVVIAENIIKNDSIFKSQQHNLLNYRRYYKQYAGFYNEGGKFLIINYTANKDIWLNAENKRWIYVLDGGNYFWQAIVNINEKTVVSISINGPA